MNRAASADDLSAGVEHTGGLRLMDEILHHFELALLHNDI